MLLVNTACLVFCQITALTAEGSISQDRAFCSVREIVAELAKKTENIFSLISSKKGLAFVKSEAQTKSAGVIVI